LDTIACSSRDYLPKRNTKIKKKSKNHKILQKNKLVVPERKLLKIKLDAFKIFDKPTRNRNFALSLSFI